MAYISVSLRWKREIFCFQLSLNIYLKKMIMVLTCDEVGFSIFIQVFAQYAMAYLGDYL